jgi:DNA-binding response OmpR family regulator
MKIIIIDETIRTVSFKGKSIFLTKKEFLLFKCITNARIKKMISVNEIISYVWQGREAIISRINISQLIFRLRRKLTLLDSSVDISFSMANGVCSHYLKSCILIKDNVLIRFISSITQSIIS